MLDHLKKHWFIAGVVMAIALAAAYPPMGKKGGPLAPEVTVKYLVVSLIFFNSGISLRASELTAAVKNLKLYAVVQGFSMMLVPAGMSLLAPLARYAFSDDIVEGLLVLGCMPPPVSSAVILTKSVGGNEAGAILNSTLGSFLGIVLTPVLLLYTVGASASAPVGKIATDLTLTVVVPLAVGQMVRARAPDLALRSGIPWSKISNVALLVIIYTTFCDTFAAELAIGFLDLLRLVLLLVAVHLASIAGAYTVAHAGVGGFSKKDLVCVMFCASHKSLTLGIPMINILFNGHPSLSLISMPLLIFHPMQIVLGSLLVTPMKEWVALPDASIA